MAAPVMAERHDTSRFKLGHEGQIRTVAASVRCMPTLPRPQTPSKADKYGPLLVPVERIELPTFGLQNRCSTAELNRRIEGDRRPAKSRLDSADVSAARISDLPAKGQDPGDCFRLPVCTCPPAVFPFAPRNMRNTQYQARPPDGVIE